MINMTIEQFVEYRKKWLEKCDFSKIENLVWDSYMEFVYNLLVELISEEKVKTEESDRIIPEMMKDELNRAYYGSFC